jgi:hypothetical protein
MVYLYLLKEGNEEGGENGAGAGEQDPLHLGYSCICSKKAMRKVGRMGTEWVSRTPCTLINYGLPVSAREGDEEGGEDGDGAGMSRTHYTLVNGLPVSAQRRRRGRRGGWRWSRGEQDLLHLG